MPFLKHMDDEQLHTFGFVIDPDDPNKAYNERYPHFSVRYKCPKCGTWSDSKGGEVMLCGLCHRGARPAIQTKQFRKLYQCCSDDSCPVWQEILAMFRSKRLPIENCYERVGCYLDLDFTKNWPEEDRDAFHGLLNDKCFSWRGARKLCCQSNKKKPNLRRT